MNIEYKFEYVVRLLQKAQDPNITRERRRMILMKVLRMENNLPPMPLWWRFKFWLHEKMWGHGYGE